MISVLTLTYKRKHILEEALQSFLNQNREDCQMIILNDYSDAKYFHSCKNVSIYNSINRFPSILKKIEFGIKLCRHEYIYRLDDDDLLFSGGLSAAIESIKENPGFDIYRSSNHYYFNNNEFVSVSNNVNNGNIYSKKYLESINFKNLSVNEDAYLTFENGGKIHTFDTPTMIYRWGMGTYHISSMNTSNPESVSKITDEYHNDEENGIYFLKPHFKHDYYRKINE